MAKSKSNKNQKIGETVSGSALKAAAEVEIHPAKLGDITQYAPNKVGQLYRGRIGSSSSGTVFEAQQMLEKIPPSQRAGATLEAAAANAPRAYLEGKKANHIVPYSKKGSAPSNNLEWESSALNRARGAQAMSQQEQMQLTSQARVENLKGALNAGLEAAPKGAMIGAGATLFLSVLRNGLALARSEMNVAEAVVKTTQETALGGGIGGASAFTVAALAAVFPPVASALSVLSPVLLAAGGGMMVYEVFRIFSEHREKVREAAENLKPQALEQPEVHSKWETEPQ
ncbi:MAG: hypothetical protein P3X23_011550 [Thermosynechococcus sp. Uc]|uniref:hypothetical protein n=1 Tax=Thermosynechococcus sp. Uc TaxID=3034853 RepID=UPI0019DF68E4|nr:hypothetical protein [Thermosynechococcus sp. Uc]MDM7327723.1 hypothetical protein [Thermosynechococcus sp. Uc]HIK24381.1 hypothetical protein [Thermosynechococcus sp. M46_R2017_013]